MEFVIGTHSILAWVRIDPSWEITDTAVLNTGHHYGIALLADTGDTILCKHNEDRLQLYRSSNPFELEDEIPFPGDHEHIHQIAYANEGIYAANTNRNSVIYQALDDGIRHEHFINDVNYDFNHVNSVFPCGEQIIVLLNNNGRTESQIVVFHHDRQKGWSLLDTLSLWHRGCHNAFVDERYLVYNSSSLGRFAIADLQDQKLIVNRNYGGHTKGLSVTDDYYIIGTSEHRDAQNRLSSPGDLLVVDRRTFHHIATVRLQVPPYGERIGIINEIRCVSGEERGHSAASPILTDLPSLSLASGDPIFRARERIRRGARAVWKPLRLKRPGQW